MATQTYHRISVVLLLLFIVSSSLTVASAGTFYEDFDLTWGDQRAKILDNGELLTLSLDQICGSGFQSKREYLFGRIDMQLKLVSGNSAGTVTAYYVNLPLHFHTTSFQYNQKTCVNKLWKGRCIYIHMIHEIIRVLPQLISLIWEKRKFALTLVVL